MKFIAPLRIITLTFMLIILNIYVPAANSAEVNRTITKIAGDLYRFQNNFHVSVFLVTTEGVIATDPINAPAAEWLKAEIKSRFGKEIKYLIYSHDHSDHSSGGEVFADTAIVVGHKNTKEAIIGEMRATAVPDITFTDRMTIELGGKKVELIYPGLSHSNNLIVMNFLEERALFTVDILSVKRLPYKNLGDAWFPDWINAVKKIETMDFDILIPGHGKMGTKADVTENREYLETLYNSVLEAARDGKTLDEMKASITLDKYKDWGQYKNWRTLNIEGVAKQIALHRRGN